MAYSGPPWTRTAFKVLNVAWDTENGSGLTGTYGALAYNRRAIRKRDEMHFGERDSNRALLSFAG